MLAAGVPQGRRKYGVAEDKAVEFMQAVRQQGMPAYAQALQPR